MLSAHYYRAGALSGFATFFGDTKRLQLIAPIQDKITMLSDELKRPLQILDLGAGTGMHAAHFAGQGHKVTALEPVSEMINEGKKRYAQTNVEFIVGSMPDLTALAGRKFDVIYSIAAWQFTQENINEIITNINVNRSEEQRLTLTQISPIKDPDNRMGIKEKNTPVYFYINIGSLPALRLECNATSEDYLTLTF